LFSFFRGINMSAILPIGRKAGGYQRVSGQDDFHSPHPHEAVHASQRTPAPPADTGVLTTIRRRLTGEGNAAGHLVPREQVLRNAFHPNGETFAQKHAGVVVPAAYASGAVALATPVLLGLAKGIQFGVRAGDDTVAKYVLGGVFGYIGATVGAIGSGVMIALAERAGGVEKKIEAMSKHSEFVQSLASASLTDVTGQDRTDAVIHMVTNFFNQTSSRATTSASSAELGRSAISANPELIAAMQSLAKNHWQYLVNIAATPEAASIENPSDTQTLQLAQAARQSNKQLMLSIYSVNSNDKPLAPFKELMTRHMVFANQSNKTDFLDGYSDTLIGDTLRQPNQVARLYPYMPKVDALKSAVIQDSFGEDCRSDIQNNIINTLHSALIKPGQDLTRVNGHIQGVQSLFKAAPSKLADISTVANPDQPHDHAATAAKALVPSIESGAQTADQLAFLKIYRGVLELAGLPKTSIRESSRQLNEQKVIDTLLRPEKMVADVQQAYLA
jgi:hypothetical protein